MTRASAPRRSGRVPAVERAEGLTPRYVLHLAVAMIRTNPRTVRTYTSVAVATVGLLLSFAAINGMGTMMTSSARDIVSGDVSAFADGYEYSMLTPETDVVYYLEGGARLVSDLEASPGVAAARPRITAGAQLSTGEHDAGVVVVGSDTEAEGYVLLAGAAPSGAGEICVNGEQRDQLELSVGDVVTLSVAGAPAADAVVEVRVACIYDTSRFGLFRSGFVVMDVAGVQSILDRPDSLTQVLLTLRPDAAVDDMVRELDAQFPGVTFSTAEETAGLIFTIQTAQRVVMWVLTAVMALVCAVLVGNVVGFSLRRQREEIATMRAMGFDANAVRAVHAVHTLLVGVLMVAVGAVAAVGSVLACGAIGIPIGGAQQLFGDSVLRPWLGVVDVLLTAALMLVALLVANLLATRAMLRLSPVEMVRDA